MILNKVVEKSRFCKNELTELLRRIDPHIDTAEYLVNDEKETVIITYIEGDEKITEVTGCGLHSMTAAVLLEIGVKL